MKRIIGPQFQITLLLGMSAMVAQTKQCFLYKSITKKAPKGDGHVLNLTKIAAESDSSHDQTIKKYESAL